MKSAGAHVTSADLFVLKGIAVTNNIAYKSIYDIIIMIVDGQAKVRYLWQYLSFCLCLP